MYFVSVFSTPQTEEFVCRFPSDSDHLLPVVPLSQDSGVSAWGLDEEAEEEEDDDDLVIIEPSPSKKAKVR